MRLLAMAVVLLGACHGDAQVRPDADPNQPEPDPDIQFVTDGAWAVEWDEGSEAPWTPCNGLTLDEQGTVLAWRGDEEACALELVGEERDFCRCYPHWLEGERSWCLCPGVQSLTADIRTDGDIVASFRARLE